jgi:hypothetical protein
LGSPEKKINVRILRDQACSIRRGSKDRAGKSKVGVHELVRELGSKNMVKTLGLSKVIEAKVA